MWLTFRKHLNAEHIEGAAAGHPVGGSRSLSSLSGRLAARLWCIEKRMRISEKEKSFPGLCSTGMLKSYIPW